MTSRGWWLVWLSTVFLGLLPPSVAGQSSLYFQGNGAAAPGLDRVEIALDAPARPVDVGASDFTIEWWMKAEPGANEKPSCVTGLDGWIFGNIFLDRDINGAGDYGDWGLSLGGGAIAFGVADSSSGAGICGGSAVDDGAWHHVAVARRSSDGQIWLWVDGVLEATGSGPSGDISYRDGRSTSSAKDPYVVIGAEKHDAGLEYPSYRGWMDELRFSTVLRYPTSGGFTPPTAPFVTDGQTAALYHFDEGSGAVLGDSSGAAGGPSDGAIQFGGSPAGPLWSSDSPFTGPAPLFADGFESGDLGAWSESSPAP